MLLITVTVISVLKDELLNIGHYNSLWLILYNCIKCSNMIKFNYLNLKVTCTYNYTRAALGKIYFYDFTKAT